MFFKPKPCLADGEKARIEFYFQQIAECIGFDRLHLPVLSRETFLGWFESNHTTEEIIRLIGEHLKHDTAGLQPNVVPKQAASCSGGG